MEQPPGIVAQGGNKEDLSSLGVFIWFETESTYVVW